MKILRLSFKNLNSLWGPWQIDFANAPLNTCGLFAITGPTGSGKTTILDAITLSLFGKTPRLNNPADEIISQHATDAFAEVVFLVKEKKYSCQWSVQRKKNFQGSKAPKMQLGEFLISPEGEETFQILEERLRRVPLKVRDLLNLDFEQFTRSIILVQDSFAAFLMSKGKDRAELLEKITGTQIYSHLSMASFERAKKEEEALLQRQREKNQLPLLSAEEILALENEKATLLQTHEDLRKKLDVLLLHEKKLIKFHELKKSQRDIARDLAILEETRIKETPNFVKLDRANQLTSLVQEDYLTYKITKSSLENQEETLVNLQKKTALTQEEEKRAAPRLRQLEEDAQKQREAQDNEEKLIHRVLVLDKEIAQEHAELHKLGINIKEKTQMVISLTSKQNKVQQECQQNEVLLNKLLLWFQDPLNLSLHESWSKLPGTVAILQEKFHRYERNQKILLATKEFSLPPGSVLALLEKERILSEVRKDLQVGCPCPLCGQIYKVQTDQPCLLPSIGEEGKAFLQLLEGLSQQDQEDLYELAQQVSPFGEHLNEWSEIPTINSNLKTKQDLFIKKTVEKDRLQQEMQELHTQMKILASEKRGEEILLSNLRKNFEEQQEKRQSLEEQRRGLYGEKDTSRELDKIKEKTLFLQKELQHQREIHQSLKEKNHYFLTQIHELGNGRIKKRQILQELSQKILQQTQTCQIATLDELEKAFLTPEERASYHLGRVQLEQRFQQTTGKMQKVQADLSALNKSQVADEFTGNEKDISTQLAQVRLESENIQHFLREGQKRLGALDERLGRNQEFHQQAQKLDAVILLQQKEFARWHQLKMLIGQASGDLFRKFAQGLTLDRLLVYSNRHLQKLNHRYQFLRNDHSEQSGRSEEMDILIIDHHQASITRSTETLSGGEKFLLSLALALGLSDLSSKKTTMESLFLDEGFGTLDSENLERALDTLENLKSLGKIVGIISHVEALKERVPVQVQVHPLGSGRSSLQVVES